jgi:rubrerythrin
MSSAFTADEVFQMAERIEINGAEFYTKAADLHSKTADVAFLRGLAKMEYQHRDTFAAMRKALPKAATELPAEYPFLKATFYLNMLADAHGGEGALSSVDPLTATDTLGDLLRKAIRLEEQAIVFYLGIREMVPANRGREKIDEIIAEEKSHVVILADYLRGLTAS